MMLNTTTRLAVSIRNLPPWEFSWDDTTPQKSRHELTVEDILPGPDDGAQFFDRAVAYTMEILVETFPSLKDLEGSCTIHHHQRELCLHEKVSGDPPGVAFQG